MIALEDLSKKLGIAKRHIMRLVYLPGSILKYTVINNKRYFNEDEVMELLKQGGIHGK